jgi:hypothetical protein
MAVELAGSGVESKSDKEELPPLPQIAIYHYILMVWGAIAVLFSTADFLYVYMTDQDVSMGDMVARTLSILIGLPLFLWTFNIIVTRKEFVPAPEWKELTVDSVRCIKQRAWQCPKCRLTLLTRVASSFRAARKSRNSEARISTSATAAARRMLPSR